MSTWQPSGPPQQWEALPPPSPWPAAPPPAAAPPRASWPLPPAAVWAAALVALASAVLFVVLLATGDVRDVLHDAGVGREDAAVLAGLLGVLAVAGLLAGAVVVLIGRGTGLLRSAGAAAAVLVVLGVVVAAVGERHPDVPVLVLCLAVAGGAAVAAGLTAAPAAGTWTAAAERRSAERAIARLAAGRTAPLPARSRASLVVALVAVAVVVVAGVVVVSGLAPEVAAEPAAHSAGSGDAGPVPVKEGDPDWSAGLDALARSCADGDLGACDALYYGADAYSDYEEYGSTCGGRSTFEYDGSCATDYD